MVEVSLPSPKSLFCSTPPHVFILFEFHVAPFGVFFIKTFLLGNHKCETTLFSHAWLVQLMQYDLLIIQELISKKFIELINHGDPIPIYPLVSSTKPMLSYENLNAQFQQ